jgi:hypothetical protein
VEVVAPQFSQSNGSERQLLINAVTGEVGPGTQVTGNPTYQDLAAQSDDNFRFADHPRVMLVVATCY